MQYNDEEMANASKEMQYNGKEMANASKTMAYKCEEMANNYEIAMVTISKM